MYSSAVTLSHAEKRRVTAEVATDRKKRDCLAVTLSKECKCLLELLHGSDEYVARLEGIIEPLLLEEPKREIEKVIYQGESAEVIIGYDSRAAVKYLPLLQKKRYGVFR